MKEIVQMSKRRRVYSHETNNSPSFTTFCVKYLAHLLQALMRASIDLPGNENKEQNLDIKKRVRFEIDMAMVVSVGTRYKWAQTLKYKLDPCQRSPKITSVTQAHEEQPCLACHGVPSSLYLSVQARGDEERTKKRWEMEAREREEFTHCMDLLKELVPIGGDEVHSMKELIGEVESYVTCLQFQVAVLRSLVCSSRDSD